MYAVIETGGKQYRVELGTELEVELLDIEPGKEINLDRVLLVADGDTHAVGQPLVKDGAVSALVLRQDRGVKTISFKYRPKARRRVKKGHRQELTVLKITDIRLGARSAADDARASESAAEAERAKVAKAATRQAAEDAALAEKLKARTPATAKTEAAAATPAATPAKAEPRSASKAKAPKASAEAPVEESTPTAKAVAPAAKPKAKAPKADAPAGKTAPAADAPKRSARAKKDE